MRVDDQQLKSVRSGQYLTDLSESFDAGVGDLKDKVTAALASLQEKPSDIERLTKYQAAVSDLQVFKQTQSSVVKIYKDIGSGIISNFR